MTKQEFITKHSERYPVELFDTCDVLMRVAANLSDLHGHSLEMDTRLCHIKNYIFDYMEVLRQQEMLQRQQEQEMAEFHAHLGR